MNFKRGQMTMFIIVGVLIVAALGFYFLSGHKNVSPTDSNFNYKAKALEGEINDCFKKVYENSLMILGFQGGEYIVEDGVDNGFTIIPYYYNDGKTNYPSLEELETNLESLVDFQIKAVCLDYYQNEQVSSDELGVSFNGLDLMDEDYSGFNLSYGEVKTDVRIQKGFVIFNPEGKFTISNGENSLSVDVGEKSTQIDSDVFLMHSIATEITDDSAKDNGKSIAVSLMGELVDGTDLSIDSASYINKEDTIVVISNNVTSMPFVYQFLIKSPGVGEGTDYSEYDI